MGGRAQPLVLGRPRGCNGITDRPCPSGLGELIFIDTDPEPEPDSDMDRTDWTDRLPLPGGEA